MATIIEYPINFYSRLVTDSSGTAPSQLIFLNHADRATVSSGTWFVDQSTWNSTIYTKGTSVIQSTAAGYFGGSGLLLDASSNDSRIVWNILGNGTAYIAGHTEPIPRLKIESLLYATSLNSAGMYWFDLLEIGGGTEYFYAGFSKPSSDWILRVRMYQVALGVFFNHDYTLPTFATGTWMHFALIRVGTTVSPYFNRIGLFQNGSQLPCIAGGFPTSGEGDWRDCSFDIPSSPWFAWGGAVDGGGLWNGYMDEMRILYDTLDGFEWNSAGLYYYTVVPTAPYLPADGTYNITAKTLVLNSSSLMPETDALLNLGQVGTQWNDLWLTGTAYVDQFGESTIFTGTNKVQFRDTTTYLFSSGTGYLTLVAGTQIDLQANVGMSAKNFIFDTATGVKIATATNQKIGFYNSTPIVQQSGNIKLVLQNLGLVASALVHNIFSFSTTSEAYVISTADELLICDSGTNFVVTLPAAVGSGRSYLIKNIGVSVVTVTANSGDVIDGSVSIQLSQYKSTRVVDVGNVNFNDAVTWGSTANVTTGSNGTISKTSGGAAWDGFAFSSNTIGNNGGVRWTVGQTTGNVILGISVENSTNPISMNYSIHSKADGNWTIYESAVSVVTGTGYTIKSVFKIDKIGSTVNYYRDSTLLYASTVAATAPTYYVDVVIYQSITQVSWSSVYYTQGNWAAI